MRQSIPIEVKVYRPGTGEGQQDLARRAAEVHADCVVDWVRNLDCPDGQKLELVQAVMEAARSARLDQRRLANQEFQEGRSGPGVLRKE